MLCALYQVCMSIIHRAGKKAPAQQGMVLGAPAATPAGQPALRWRGRTVILLCCMRAKGLRSQLVRLAAENHVCRAA